jgi:hypothetical protein
MTIEKETGAGAISLQNAHGVVTILVRLLQNGLESTSSESIKKIFADMFLFAGRTVDIHEVH